MKRYGISLIILNILVPMILGACNLGVTTRPDLDILISYPEEGSIMTLGSIPIYASSVNHNSRITVRDMAFFKNAEFIERDTTLEIIDGSDFRQYNGDIIWEALEPGEYLLQAMTERTVVSSAPVKICVIDFQIPQASIDFPNPPTGYEGPCPIPERDEFATPGEQSLTASAFPDHLLYRPEGVTGCLLTEPISFEADLLDPSQDVAFVLADYSVHGTLSGSHSGETFGRTIVLNYTTTSPGGIKSFAGSSVYSLNNSLAEYYGSETGEVTWTVRAIGRDGTTILSVGPFTIPVEPCMPSGIVPPILLNLETPTETPTLTATPASDKDCPAGTYFAPATNRCIAIQIITSVPGNGNDGGSGGNSCTEPPAGCGPSMYWSSKTCSCQVLQ